MRVARLSFCLPLLLSLAIVSACNESSSRENQYEAAMAASVSNSGDYAISSHHSRKLVVWGIGDKQHKAVADDINIYSAEVVPKRNAYLWQDLDNSVTVKTFNGKQIAQFKAPEPAYSHDTTSSLDHYLLSDKDWRLYHRGPNGNFSKIKDGKTDTLLGLGKPFNVAIDSKGNRAVLAGFGAYYHKEGLDIEAEESDGYQRFDGVAVWNLKTGRPTLNLSGNSAKTHATTSPDGQHVVAVDENGQGFHWDLEEGTKQQLASLRFGIDVDGEEAEPGQSFDKSGMHLDYPEDFPEGFERAARIGVHFVSDQHYLCLYHNQPYAAIYRLGDPFARALVDLGTDPFPSVDRYSRNEAVDSSPQANLLVTGQRSQGGINVYRFHPEDLTLEKLWTPTP